MPISIRTKKKSEEDMEEELNLSLQLGSSLNKRKREKFSEKGIIDNQGGDENKIETENNFEEPSLMHLSLPSVLSERKNKQMESSQDQFTQSMIRENSKATTALLATCQHSTTSSDQKKQSIGNNTKEEQANIADSHVATVSDTAAMNEDEYSHAKKKLRLSKEQAFLLEENFRNHATLNPKLKVTLAKELSLQPRQVEVWFQNRRARTKLKQTEIDCKYLKHRYHMLSLENCRLKMEVAELRTFNMVCASAAHPFYKHMPATGGLPLCPSCVHSTSFYSDTTTGPSNRKPATFASLLLKPQF